VRRPQTRARLPKPSHVRRRCRFGRRTCPSTQRKPPTCRRLSTSPCLRAVACRNRDSDRRTEWSLGAIWVRIVRAVSPRDCFPLLRPRAVGAGRKGLHRGRVELVPAVRAAIRACRDIRAYGCWIRHGCGRTRSGSQRNEEPTRLGPSPQTQSSRGKGKDVSRLGQRPLRQSGASSLPSARSPACSGAAFAPSPHH
jgi:hypothetical protein